MSARVGQHGRDRPPLPRARYGASAPCALGPPTGTLGAVAPAQAAQLLTARCRDGDILEAQGDAHLTGNDRQDGLSPSARSWPVIAQGSRSVAGLHRPTGSPGPRDALRGQLRRHNRVEVIGATDLPSHHYQPRPATCQIRQVRVRWAGGLRGSAQGLRFGPHTIRHSPIDPEDPADHFRTRLPGPNAEPWPCDLSCGKEVIPSLRHPFSGTAWISSAGWPPSLPEYDPFLTLNGEVGVVHPCQSVGSHANHSPMAIHELIHLFLPLLKVRTPS